MHSNVEVCPRLSYTGRVVNCDVIVVFLYPDREFPPPSPYVEVMLRAVLLTFEATLLDLVRRIDTSKRLDSRDSSTERI